jgi:hypothetical protein
MFAAPQTTKEKTLAKKTKKNLQKPAKKRKNPQILKSRCFSLL